MSLTACTACEVEIYAKSMHGQPRARRQVTETQRLEVIEIKLAHLERAINDISDVVARQQRELDQVRLRTLELGRQLASLDSGAAADAAAEEKPPHY
jgi:SlyX protein